MIFCARATRGFRRSSLDASSGRFISPHPREITSELGGSIYIVRALEDHNQATLEKKVSEWSEHAQDQRGEGRLDTLLLLVLD